MANKQLQLRRGTTVQHGSFTGGEGEVTYDTDKKTLVVHDAATQGGNEILRADLDNLPAGSVDNADLANSSITVTDGSNSTLTALGGTITFSGTANEVTVGESSGTVTMGLPDNVVLAGTLSIGGNLVVSGTQSTVNTETINLADNIITLNSNEAGAPSQNAGIEVKRGTSTNVSLRWNETSDNWELTEDGINYKNIIHTGDTGTVSDTILADDAVTGGKIAAGVVVDSHIGAGTFSFVADKLEVSGVSTNANSVVNKAYVDANGGLTNWTESGNHLLPSGDNTHDIGSAEFKIRDAYISDNSLWVGDNHKVEIKGGKTKFRKRNKNKIPNIIWELNINQANPKTEAELKGLINDYAEDTTYLSEVSLSKWLSFYLDSDASPHGLWLDPEPVAGTTAGDLFNSAVDSDWEEADNTRTLPPTLPGSVIYLDSSYSGTESGTEAQPYNTFQEAWNVIPNTTGDTTFFFKPGTYYVGTEFNSGSAEATVFTGKLSFIGSSREDVFLKGSTDGSISKNGLHLENKEAGIHVENLTLQDCTYGFYFKDCATDPGTRVRIINVHMTKCGSKGILDEHEDNGKTQSECDDIWTSSTTSNGGAMRIRGCGIIEISDCLVNYCVRGLRIQDCKSGGVIQNNLVHNVLDNAIYLASGSYDGEEGCNGFVVRDNTVVEAGQHGLQCIGGFNNRFTNNSVTDTWGSGFMGWHTCGLTVEDNRFFNCTQKTFTAWGGNADAFGQIYLAGGTKIGESSSPKHVPKFYFNVRDNFCVESNEGRTAGEIYGIYFAINNTALPGRAVYADTRNVIDAKTHVYSDPSLNHNLSAVDFDGLSGPLSTLPDLNIGTPADANVLIWDGADSWVNKAVSGDATINSAGEITLVDGAVKSKKTDFIEDSVATADGNLLVGDTATSEFKSVAISGDATLANTGALTIANDAITPAKMSIPATDVIHVDAGRTDSYTEDGSVATPYKDFPTAFAANKPLTEDVTFHLAPGVYIGVTDTDSSEAWTGRLSIIGSSRDQVIIKGAASGIAVDAFYFRHKNGGYHFENITITGAKYGIYLRDCDTGGKVRLINVCFRECGSTGVATSHDGSLDQAAQAAIWAGGAGATVSNGGATRIQSCFDVEVRDCLVEYCLRGLRVQDCTRGIIQGNKTYRTLESGIYLAAGSYDGGLGFDGCKQFVVKDNVVEEAANNSVLIIGGKGSVVENNTILKGWNSPIMGWHVLELTIRNNTMIGCNHKTWNGIGNDGDAFAQIDIAGSTDIAAGDYCFLAMGNLAHSAKQGRGHAVLGSAINARRELGGTPGATMREYTGTNSKYVNIWGSCDAATPHYQSSDGVDEVVSISAGVAELETAIVSGGTSWIGTENTESTAKFKFTSGSTVDFFTNDYIKVSDGTTTHYYKITGGKYSAGYADWITYVASESNTYAVIDIATSITIEGRAYDVLDRQTTEILHPGSIKEEHLSVFTKFRAVRWVTGVSVTIGDVATDPAGVIGAGQSVDRTYAITCTENITVTLPSPAEGSHLHIKRIKASTEGKEITVTGAGSAKIEDSSEEDKELTEEDEVLTLVADGIDWWVI